MTIKRIYPVAGVTLALSMACAAYAAAASPGAGKVKSYDIVTEMRPESLETFLHLPRTAYDICAMTRHNMKLGPALPFVTVPADFVFERKTYLRSGDAYLIRDEQFFVDINDAQPEKGCKTRIAPHTTESVVRAGQLSRQEWDADGNVQTDEPDTIPPPYRKGDGFTEQKTVDGIAMRCIPVGGVIGPGQAMCAADAGTGVLVDGFGDPILLYVRQTIPVYTNTTFLTKPVSVQIGKPVSQQRISLSKVK